MWFKNACIYRLKQQLPYQSDLLESVLAQHAFVPCAPITTSSLGWVAPLNKEGAPLVHAGNGFILICLMIEEKLLPPSVVKSHVDERVKTIQTQEDRKVYKNERLRLKDELIFDLLPRAFSRTQRIYAIFDTQSQILMIDSSSPKRIDCFIELLKTSLPDLKLEKPELRDLSQVMTSWLHDQKSPTDFMIEDHCLMQDPRDQACKIRCQKQDLMVKGVQAFLKEGHLVRQITLTWQDQVRFTLTEEMQLKQIKFLETILELSNDITIETPEDRFDTDFTLMSETLRGLIDHLMALCVKDHKSMLANPKTVETT